MSRSNSRLTWCVLPTLSAGLILLVTATTAAIPHIYYDDLGLTLWRSSWQQALQEAQQTGKPLYVQITHPKCDSSKDFNLNYISRSEVQTLLRRYFVCFAGDFHHLPRDLERIRATKGYTDAQTPLHLLLTPKSEVLGWLVKVPIPEEFVKFLKQAATDKQFQMGKQQELEVEKAVQALDQALKSKDAKKTSTAWQTFLRHPGYSEAKNKGFELMESAEEPARKKLVDAARLIREQKYPLAQLALDEAKQASERLPISSEVQNSLAAFALLQRAAEAERQATTTKQKLNVSNQYQQIINKYPDNMLATVAYQKLLKLNQTK